MNVYRRNTFRHWCADVGYIYLIAIALVALAYLMGNFFGDLAIELRAAPEANPAALSDRPY